MRAYGLHTERRDNPLGLGEPSPHLSWLLAAEERGALQAGYRVVVSSSVELAAGGTGDLWDSGRVPSSRSFGIEYAGPALTSAQRCWWSVQVWDEAGERSAWAKPVHWEMGLLESTDWTATWISAPADVWQPVDEPPTVVNLGEWRGARPVYLRTEFDAAEVVSARAYVTARGLYELHLNGARVGNELLRPGWTDYGTRIQYQVYDVSELLVEGPNAVGVLLGTGWYSGRVAWGEHLYGERPSALVQLHLELADGSRRVVGSDGTWRAAASPLLWSDLLMGEAYDARARRPGWDRPGLDLSDWAAVEAVPAPFAVLVAETSPPVRRLAERSPEEVVEIAPGVWRFDLGQNMVGWARVRLTGPAGTEVRLRFAEMLESDGTLHVDNLRKALATEVVVLDGGEVVHEPSFTAHGFRYVELVGFAGTPTTQTVTGVVVGSDIPAVGSFTCSDELVNKLQSNIEWGQRGNFLEVPTDCPQRDERLGWTGDAQVFVRTACWNADAGNFFGKWLQDLADTQRPDGAVGDVAPLVRPELFGAAAPGWGDAAVMVPWDLYRIYGDQRFLERCYPMMTGWVDYLHAANPDHLWTASRGMDYGDWLSIDAETPKDLLATAFYAHSCDLVARAAEALGHKEDRARYGELFSSVREAFNHAYVTPSGRIVGHQQAAYALALSFDLLPEHRRAAGVGFLVQDIRARGNHLSTGFLGVAHLLPVLTRFGHLDVAYELLHQDTFPSWGYTIRHGATTIWERWDAWTAEAGFKNHGMNSFNHYALGSVGEWLYSVAAGISQAQGSVGFERVRVAPRPGGRLSSASATYRSVRGTLRSSWQQHAAGLRLEVDVPANVLAEVVVPGVLLADLLEGGVPVSEARGVTPLGDRETGAAVEVGSGTYVFTSP